MVGFHPEAKHCTGKERLLREIPRGVGVGGTGRERTRVCTHVHEGVGGQEVRYPWCCAIPEDASTVPADPADSAVPAAVPEVKTSSSVQRRFSGNKDPRATETVSLFLFLRSCCLMLM